MTKSSHVTEKSFKRSTDKMSLLHRLKAAKYEIQKPSTCHATLSSCKFCSMFRVFPLVWSTCHATKTFAAGWRNAARWLVDLLGVSKRQVASLMKDELQSQRRPALYFSQKLSSTPTSWSRNAKNAKHRPKTCNETMLRDKLKVFVSCISLP